MRTSLSLMLIAGLISCGDDAASTAAPDAAPDAGQADQSLAETLGLLGYAGAITPLEESRDGDVTVYTFDAAEGPLCMRGDAYRVSVRDMPTSEDLVIFLQGGGACWSEFCLAVTGAPAGVPGVDILNKDLAGNPVAAWDVVYLPYCDGSFFAGDAEHDDDLNGRGKRSHRGLANLTAALEVATARFPDARRILLAGSSGGAYGLMMGAPLTRHYYPDAELIVMADSGVGLARGEEPTFLDGLLDEFGVRGFLPPDCPTCIADGHITGLLGWFLERDANSRVGIFSSWYDGILGDVFLGVAPEAFADALEQQTDALRQAHPDRFRRFIIDGIQHTALLADASGIIGSDLDAVELPDGAMQKLAGGSLEIGGMTTTELNGVTIAAWLAALIEGDLEAWVDTVEARGPAPDWE